VRARTEHERLNGDGAQGKIYARIGFALAFWGDDRGTAWALRAMSSTNGHRSERTCAPFSSTGNREKSVQSTVSERALFERCRRKLLRERGLMLRRCAERSRWFYDLGRYYMVNDRNHVSGPPFSSLEEMGRDLGVLRPGERLIE